MAWKAGILVAFVERALWNWRWRALRLDHLERVHFLAFNHQICFVACLPDVRSAPHLVGAGAGLFRAFDAPKQSRTRETIPAFLN